MANTYTLISSNVLTSSAASVTFSAIPSTYTDLVLRTSTRSDAGGTQFDLILEFNGDSSSLYSFTQLRGTGSAAQSFRSSNNTKIVAAVQNGANSTFNTFTTSEIYIPSYTASQNKPVSAFGAQEDNSTDAMIRVAAGLYRSTTAINSIKFYNDPTYNFVSGSSFYLYGIKNS